MEFLDQVFFIKQNTRAMKLASTDRIQATPKVLKQESVLWNHLPLYFTIETSGAQRGGDGPGHPKREITRIKIL